MTGRAIGSNAHPDEARPRWVCTPMPPAGNEATTRIGRLVLTGSAAKVKRSSIDDSRAILATALRALTDGGLRLDLLVTPAGFLDVKDGPGWFASKGWHTSTADFTELADRARAAVPSLITPEILSLADGTVGHLVLGIDIWPTEGKRPYGETACVFGVRAGTVTHVTGKSFPNGEQEGHLIREPCLKSHVLAIAGERVAILVCHDLAAWHPMGMAVRKGIRAAVGDEFNELIEREAPTIAVQLPHTLDKVKTWCSAWPSFARHSGGELRSGTSAIRYRTLGRHTPPIPLGAHILAGTGRGDRVVDIVVHDPGAWPDAPR